MASRPILALALGVLALAVPASPAPGEEAAAFEEVDCSKVPRSIAREPGYVCAPQYALFLFGPKGEMRVWAVLDGSGAELPCYDVLYLDKNADGDLTASGERFTAKLNPAMADVGVSLWIRAGDLVEPGTSRVHQDLRFSTIPKTDRRGIWFTKRWCGRETVCGGAALTGSDCTVWGASPKSAPILRPTAEGPRSFAIWGPATLAIGAEGSLSLLIGNAGSGPNTLCYLSEDFLTPEKDRIRAVVHARDLEGGALEIPRGYEKHC
jgi:hypothetical protein